MSLLFLLFSSSGYAGFRCGTHLIDRGEYIDDVLEKCGPPTSVQRSGEIGQDRNYDFGDNNYDSAHEGVTEEWIYDFGDRRLKQYLRFENGVLEETRDLNYGR
ncbi:MAG: DUF2845 domain-containing protein [Gammaproteobacteria bacterium]